jgi:hypothetical protein
MTLAAREHRILRRMNNRIVCGLLTCAMTLAGCVEPAAEKKNAPAPPPPATVSTPGTLQSAHDAYLEGDFLALGERVRDVLLDTRSNDLVKENAMALLDKAFETQKGSLPSRFVLPPGFEGIKYGVVRGLSGQSQFFHVFLYGHTRDASHLKSVSVRRLPDEVLLDSTADSGKGSFKLKHDKPGYDTFVVERVMTSLPSDGVLSLRFDLDDGTSPEGWFISRSQSSSATPEIRTPLSSTSIKDVHPVVSWVPFRSPEYKPFEFRTLSVYVSMDGADGVSWDIWMQNYGELGQVKVGDQPPAAKTSLIPGDYWLNITCGEGRMFGPVAMTRESRTVAPFHVAVP